MMMNNSVSTFAGASPTSTSASPSPNTNVASNMQLNDMLSAHAVASLPPPGLSGPTNPVFAPHSSRYLAFVSSAASHISGNNSSVSGNSLSSLTAAGSVAPATVKSPPVSLYKPLTSTGTNDHNNSSSSNTTGSPFRLGANGIHSTSAATTTTSTPTTPTKSSSAATVSTERILMCIDLSLPNPTPRPLLQLNTNSTNAQQQQQSSSATAPLSPFLEASVMASTNSTASTQQQQQQQASKRRMLSNNVNTATTTANSTIHSMNSNSNNIDNNESLQERLRRERQRVHGATQFSWAWTNTTTANDNDNTFPMNSSSSNNMNHTSTTNSCQKQTLRVLVPARGSLFVQDGIYGSNAQPARLVHDKAFRSTTTSSGSDSKKNATTCCSNAAAAVDPQLSPDGRLIAWTQADGEIYCKSATASPETRAVRLSYGATAASPQQHDNTNNTVDSCISHGVAEFVAQEEMDRYRGFWWHPDSNGILLSKVDESNVPVFRIVHHAAASTAAASTSTTSLASTLSSHSESGGAYYNNNSNNNMGAEPTQQYEDHRYPFAGKQNPTVTLGFVGIDTATIIVDGVQQQESEEENDTDTLETLSSLADATAFANWQAATWWEPPREAHEYLARVHWLPGGHAAALWQNRAQNVSVLQRLEITRTSSQHQQEREPGRCQDILIELSDVWINLQHHQFHVLKRPIHPSECNTNTDETTTIPPPLTPQQLSLPHPPSLLPEGSFSFLFASEVSGFAHLYLYTFAPGYNSNRAALVRTVSSGEWMVENVCGLDLDNDVVYFTGTFDSVLERHLYALPLLNNRRQQKPEDEQLQQQEQQCTQTLQDEQPHSSSSTYNSNTNSITSNNGSVRRGLSKMINALGGGGGSSSTSGRSGAGAVSSTPTSNNKRNSLRPRRLTPESGTHNIVMDESCRYFVDTSSDLDRPTSVKLYELTPSNCSGGDQLQQQPRFVMTLYDAIRDDKSLSRTAQQQQQSNNSNAFLHNMPAPEILSFPTSDGSETLYAALYRPDPRLHGPGPYPLICAVYGGPHVQRVNRSWSQSADMRAQRLRNLGFCVVKCDNRGSSRRGLVFEGAIARRLGRVEVLDQVAAVRQMVVRGIADPTRVGVYGWSYGGYLSAMCLCRAPDVFHAAVAGAPVTSWDGYDTHYTERYMGLPADNPAGYRESAVFDHVPNMRGKLMIVHGLIDENVHFRHTARLINKLAASGKDYELLIFPDERHSPRRLRDRVYMEQRISEFFLKHLSTGTSALDLIDTLSRTGGLQGFRTMAGHL